MSIDHRLAVELVVLQVLLGTGACVAIWWSTGLLSVVPAALVAMLVAYVIGLRESRTAGAWTRARVRLLSRRAAGLHLLLGASAYASVALARPELGLDPVGLYVTAPGVGLFAAAAGGILTLCGADAAASSGEGL